MKKFREFIDFVLFLKKYPFSRWVLECVFFCAYTYQAMYCPASQICSTLQWTLLVREMGYFDLMLCKSSLGTWLTHFEHCPYILKWQILVYPYCVYVSLRTLQMLRNLWMKNYLSEGKTTDALQIIVVLVKMNW